MRSLIAALILLAGLAGASAAPCEAPEGCSVGGGRYLVQAPQGWDGTNPRPAIVFLHGWRESAAYVLADKVVTEFAARHGALLIAVDGAGGGWSFPGGSASRDDLAFLAAVAEDVKARFAVNSSRFVVIGFSLGGSMVWSLACRVPRLFSHYAALAGGFWEPSPERCTGQGVNLVHVHGLADPTVPMAGRQLRNGRRQSDLWRDWRIWLSENRCQTSPAASLAAAPGRSCQLWTGCGRPQALALCLHESGHEVHESDLEAVWTLVERQQPTP